MEPIVLVIDVNENMYTRPLACKLHGDGLFMEEQMLCLTGNEAPYSHSTGKVAIVGTFATPGIICTNSYLSPHSTGVSDYMFQLHNFDAHTVLRTAYPKMVHPNGRALRCGVECRVRKYNKVLLQMLTWHRAFEKLEFFQRKHSV